MKKQNVLNLIKYHVEKNESAFKTEAINIARVLHGFLIYSLILKSVIFYSIW